MGLLLVELLVWWLTHETTHTPDDILARVGTNIERHISHGVDLRPPTEKKWQKYSASILSWLASKTFRDLVKDFVIRPLEVANTIWLTYIIFAQ